MNNNPIFVGTPVIQAAVSEAATNRDGSGTYTLLFDPGVNGSRIERVTAIVGGTAASTAKAVRLYIKDTVTNTIFLYREGLLPASTPSSTVLGSNITFNFNGGLCIGPSAQLWGGQSVGNTGGDRLCFVTEGGDF